MPDDRGDDRETRERIERIIEQILGSDRLRESSAFSERSYGDEPILRTGADLRREQESRTAREQRRRQREQDRRGGRATGGSTTPHAGRARRSHESQARFGFDALDPLAGGERVSDQQSAWDWADGWLRTAKPRKVGMPPTLKRLRALQEETDERGMRLRGNELFVRQARVAADYEDDFDHPCTPGYRYTPSYRDLTNAELRDYFSWRTQWRHDSATRMPFTYVRLAAAELVNGIGAEPGEPTLKELQRLQRESLAGDAQGMGPNIDTDLRQWIRDYAIYHHLDPRLVVTDDEREFADNVATLRLAEREVLAREGLRGLTPADVPAEPPSDARLWQAMGELSTYPLQRSPFFRTHEEAAAAVGAGVFRQLARHCAKRRKTNLVDGLLGSEDSRYYAPFLGLPFVDENPPADMTMRLTAAETVSYRFGRWHLKRGYDRVAKNRELGRLLRAIDRQMRLDWEFGRPLKERETPKYLQRMIQKESAAEHEREAEAERRKITIDLSQLKHIRSAAAKTREALLVDEEREGYVPAPEVAPATPAAPAAPQAPSAPVTAGPDAGAELGLSELELSVVRRLLAGEEVDDLLGPGAPMLSVLVDGINEKLFDEIGDTVIEFDDNGAPHLVEDYVDDLRSLLLGV